MSLRWSWSFLAPPRPRPSGWRSASRCGVAFILSSVFVGFLLRCLRHRFVRHRPLATLSSFGRRRGWWFFASSSSSSWLVVFVPLWLGRLPSFGFVGFLLRCLRCRFMRFHPLILLICGSRLGSPRDTCRVSLSGYLRRCPSSFVVVSACAALRRRLN